MDIICTHNDKDGDDAMRCDGEKTNELDRKAFIHRLSCILDFWKDRQKKYKNNIMFDYLKYTYFVLHNTK